MKTLTGFNAHGQAVARPWDGWKVRNKPTAYRRPGTLGAVRGAYVVQRGPLYDVPTVGQGECVVAVVRDRGATYRTDGLTGESNTPAKVQNRFKAWEDVAVLIVPRDARKWPEHDGQPLWAIDRMAK